MADHVTEAVRRLRELQESVERIKADRDTDGEVRFLRDVLETSISDDDVETTVRTATPAVCDFDNADQSDAG